MGLARPPQENGPTTILADSPDVTMANDLAVNRTSLMVRDNITVPCTAIRSEQPDRAGPPSAHGPLVKVSRRCWRFLTEPCFRIHGRSVGGVLTLLAFEADLGIRFADHPAPHRRVVYAPPSVGNFSLTLKPRSMPHPPKNAHPPLGTLLRNTLPGNG
jgi:hypothetical protein